MEQKNIRNAVLSHLAAMGTQYVPAGVSARHVHLTQTDMECLFGSNYTLNPCKSLSQPGQFAAVEKVTVIGPRSEIPNVRVLGPVRGATQVEMTFSEVKRLGIPGQVRMSGDVDNTPGCILRGPMGELSVPQGVIVPARHLHLSTQQAACYGLKNGQVVAVRMGGQRPGLLDQVICRVGEGHDLEFHLDTDEANALCVASGDLLELVAHKEKQQGCSCGGCKGACHEKSHENVPPPPPPARECGPMDLVTERDVEEAWKRGIPIIRCLPRCIVTDAARERAMSLDIEIKR